MSSFPVPGTKRSFFEAFPDYYHSGPFGFDLPVKYRVRSIAQSSNMDGDIVMGERSVRGRRYYRRGIVKRRRYVRGRRYRRRVPVRVGGWANPSRAESKFIDVNLSAVDVSTTTSATLLNGSIPGTGPSNRIGRKLVMTSIEIKARNYVIGGAGVDQSHRVLLVYDKQPNGVALTAADVLDNATTIGLKKLDNRGRFTILMDKHFELSKHDEALSTVGWKFYRKLKMPVIYNSGNAGTIADINTGSLYLVCIGDVVNDGTDGAIQAWTRIRYADV